MSIGPFEILIIVSVLLLIIGPRRVTNMTRSLGRGIQDFASELTVGHQRSAIGKGKEDDTEDEGRKPPKTTDKP